METIWVVVADHVRARVFESAGPHGALAETEDLVHPEGRLHANEMASDRPGVTHDGAGEGPHGMGQEVEPREVEAARFAKEISRALADARVAGKFDRLYVIAEARFLGNMRSAMDVEVRRRLAGEVSLDLTRASVEDIRAHLPEFL